MARLAEWVEGARPRTLPAAIAPVAIGTGLAVRAEALAPVLALLCLIVAIALQVGVNFANDYSDGVKGTDERRVGPVRLVGQGLAAPAAVRAAAFAAFVVAMLAGLAITAIIGQWWLLAVGAACVAAAWLYTGGPRPYGYHGLGEVFVLVFFGLVPVCGTEYVQTLTVSAAGVLGGIAVGLLSCAVLVTNNLRDIPTDRQTGKRTLAVRLGDPATRALYVTTIATAAAATVLMAFVTTPWLLITLIAFAFAVPPLRVVYSGAVGPSLIPALKGTGILVLAYGLIVGTGLAVL